MSFAIFEWGAKWIYHPIIHNCRQFCQRSSDPDLLWEHIPNIRRNIKGNGFRNLFQISIDPHGFRRQRNNISIEKPAGVFRVLFLGDSVVEGEGVNDGAVFSTLLENEIPDSQMLNAGVAGYNTYQEVASFFRKGRIFLPDVVILGSCFNDLYSKMEIEEVWQLGEKVRFAAGYSPSLRENGRPKTGEERMSLGGWFYKNLYSYKLIEDCFITHLEKWGVWRWAVRKFNKKRKVSLGAGCGRIVRVMEDSDSIEMRWFIKQVLKLREGVSHMGGQLIVLIFPFRCQVVQQMSEAQNNMMSVLAEHQIESYDLTRVLDKNDFRDPLHLNAQGHRKVADFLKEILLVKNRDGSCFCHSAC